MEKAAIIQAVIKGKQAAVDAWQAGMSTGGPWAPLVAASYAAASLANTGSMIKSIKAGGSSQGSVSGGGGGATTAAATSGGQQQQAQQQPQTVRQSFDINVIGEGLLSTDQVRALMNQITEQRNDGVEG
jgi:hypothetical protein